VSFNWRLVHAPPDVLVYVVVHELAHLREMNHSPRFWALVEAYCPDFQRNSAWLKREGWRLRQDAQLAL
jgi:predicted metal-dependent hydrolase